MIHWRTHRVSKKSNDRQIPDLQEGKETSQSHCRNTETPTQGQPQKMLWPTSPKKPTSLVLTHKEQKRLKKVQQAQQRAVKREKGVEAYPYVWNPSMSLSSLTLQSAMGKAQTNRVNPNTIETTMPLINNLCTQLESLSLNEREEVINCLCIAWGESYSQLVQLAWRKRSNAEGIYLSIWKSMQLHVFIHLAHKWDEAAALLDSGATENFIQELYAQQLKLPVRCLLYTWPVYNVDGTLNKNGHIIVIPT